MGTRATFKIIDSENGTTNYFYKHHDGYPRGAAEVLEILASDFSLENIENSNTRLEQIEADEIPNDIEYLYQIDSHATEGTAVTVFEVIDFELTLRYKETLDIKEFISKNA